MANYIKTLKEDNDDTTYPVTKSGAVILNDGTDLETKLTEYVTAEDLAVTSAQTPLVGTNMIADGAVTEDKLSGNAVCIMKYLGVIDASEIPYKTTGNGYSFDVRTYFANMSTELNRPMVFDELKLVLDISVTDTSAIHYFRFGKPDGASNLVVRNMLTLDSSGTVACQIGDITNAIIGIRLGSNTEVIIRPYGGTVRKPTLADDLTLVTISDNSSVNFGSSGTRINLNTLYRLQLSDYVMYLFQNDSSGTLFNGTIKIYGIKYPIA